MTSLLIISLIWKVWLFQTNNASICIFPPGKCTFQLSKFSVMQLEKANYEAQGLSNTNLQESSKTQHNLLFSSKPESYQTIFFYLSLQNKKIYHNKYYKNEAHGKNNDFTCPNNSKDNFLDKGRNHVFELSLQISIHDFTQSKFPRIPQRKLYFR